MSSVSYLIKNNASTSSSIATITTYDSINSYKITLDNTSYDLNPHFLLILSLSVFVVLGFFGNLLVCLAIKIDPKLQNATNYYLFSLASTDMLVSIIVIPLAIVRNIFNIWVLGNAVCTIWIFLDVFLCTNSILLLCAISCERYVGIKEPLKNREKSKSKTKLIIFLIWFSSIILSCPVLVLSYLDETNVIRNGNCSLFNKNFIIYGSICSFIIPLFVMLTMYCLTVRRLLIVLKEFKHKSKGDSKSKSKNKTKKGFSKFLTIPFMKKRKESLNEKNDSKNPTKILNTIKDKSNNNESKVLILNSCSKNNFLRNNFERVYYGSLHSNVVLPMDAKDKKNSIKLKASFEKKTISDNRIENNFTEINNSSNSTTNSTINSVCSTAPSNSLTNNNAKKLLIRKLLEKAKEEKSANETQCEQTNQSINCIEVASPVSPTSPLSPSEDTKGEFANKNRFKNLVNKHRLMNRVVNNFQMSRESAAVKNEEKAVKVLGIVFFVFVIAWGPFAVVNIILGYGGVQGSGSFYDKVLNVLTWLGYISSSINPLIYNAFNDKFRYAFRQLIKCNLVNLRKRSFKKDASTLSKIIAQDLNKREDQSVQSKFFLIKDDDEGKSFKNRKKIFKLFYK